MYLPNFAVCPFLVPFMAQDNFWMHELHMHFLIEWKILEFMAWHRKTFYLTLFAWCTLTNSCRFTFRAWVHWMWYCSTYSTAVQASG